VKTFVTIWIGLILALATAVVVNVLASFILDAAHVGNYTDLLYIIMSICILIVLSLKKWWVIAGAFTVGALCFFTPITLLILIIVGCAIGQCPVF
jgi:hypothetical protein